MSVTLRVVWLLPLPVRTAQMEMTGFVLLTIVGSAPARTKCAPREFTSAAFSITY